MMPTFITSTGMTPSRRLSSLEDMFVNFDSKGALHSLSLRTQTVYLRILPRSPFHFRAHNRDLAYNPFPPNYEHLPSPRKHKTSHLIANASPHRQSPMFTIFILIEPGWKTARVRGSPLFKLLNFVVQAIFRDERTG